MNGRSLADRIGDRFRTLSPRDRRALLVGTVILVPVLAWSGLVQPYRRALADLQDRLAAERALLEREMALLQEAPDLPGRLETAHRTVEQWESRLVRSANPALAEAEVTSRLERLARESRVLLQEVRAMTPPSGNAIPEGVAAIRLSVRGESDFEGVIGFLYGLEYNPLLLRVGGVSVSPASPEGGGERGSAAAVQPGAMTFTAIVEAFMPANTNTGEVLK
jgi:hypothetical protein